VSGVRRAQLADRKALLAARAELDRAQVLLAVHDIRTIVSPAASVSQIAHARPVAALLVGVVAPLMGRSRFGRWLRIASLAVTAYRIVRSLRSVAR
jgi:hypothetical protein